MLRPAMRLWWYPPKVLCSVTCVTPAFFQKLISSRQSFSEPVPVEVQPPRPPEAGSLPSASTRRRSLSNSATALGPGGSDSIIQPSPHFAIRCSVTSIWPPNHSGILRLGGRGLFPVAAGGGPLPLH